MSVELDTVRYLDKGGIERSCIELRTKLSNGIRCFWCCEYSLNPIACPQRFVPNQLEKNYKSHTSSNHHTIREDIISFPKSSKEDARFVRNIPYESVGAFCSFSCCTSWINERVADPKYKESKPLLYKIYYDNGGRGEILPSPHWSMLKEFGGCLSKEEFRKGREDSIFINRGTIRQTFSQIGTMFEKEYKLI